VIQGVHRRLLQPIRDFSTDFTSLRVMAVILPRLSTPVTPSPVLSSITN
jgi:hypothetical protein